MLQYNLAPSYKSEYNIVYCNTLTQPHQSCNTMPWLAIQLSCHTIAMQYNCSLTIQFLPLKTFSCNTILYPPSYITIQFFFPSPPAAPVTIQFLYCDTLSCSQPYSCNTNPRLQYKFFIFHSFLLSCWKFTQKKKTYIHIFFFTHAIGKIPKTISIHFFFSFLPATGRYTKKIYLFYFFSLFCYWTTKKNTFSYFFFPHSPVPQ